MAISTITNSFQSEEFSGYPVYNPAGASASPAIVLGYVKTDKCILAELMVLSNLLAQTNNVGDLTQARADVMNNISYPTATL